MSTHVSLALMPSKTSNHSKSFHRKIYVCRVCRHRHALRKCKRFLQMNVAKRQQIVRDYGYCGNCLAHSHSEDSCFTKTGCKYCNKNHHTLLHENQRLRSPKVEKSHTQYTNAPKEGHPPKAAMSASINETATLTLSAILKQNSITLLPTILAKISSKNEEFVVRCLLDSASKVSCISSKTVEKLGLTSLTLDEETLCPTTLISRNNPDIKLEVTLKVNNRISIRTPNRSISSNIKTKFDNMVLADPEFYKCSFIEIVLGVDVYSVLITDGIIIRTGLPTAQNTRLGWVLYGICPNANH